MAAQTNTINEAGKAGRAVRKRAKTGANHLAGYIFISPWLIGFLLLTLWPIAQSLYLSFTDYSLLEDPVWTGTSNYVNIFTNDSTFTKSLTVTFTFVLFSVPLKLLFRFSSLWRSIRN